MRRSRVFLVVGLALVLGVGIGGCLPIVATPLSPTDTLYACFSQTGEVTSAIKLNSAPSSCPNTTDTVRSWTAQGPPGPPGPPGSSTLAGLIVQVNSTGSSYAGRVIARAGQNEFSEIDCLAPSPFGIWGDCTEVYPIGTQVKLQVEPVYGDFVGWSGACTGTDFECVLTMDGDKTAIAEFRDFGLP